MIWCTITRLCQRLNQNLNETYALSPRNVWLNLDPLKRALQVPSEGPPLGTSPSGLREEVDEARKQLADLQEVLQEYAMFGDGQEDEVEEEEVKRKANPPMTSAAHGVSSERGDGGGDFRGRQQSSADNLLQLAREKSMLQDELELERERAASLMGDKALLGRRIKEAMDEKTLLLTGLRQSLEMLALENQHLVDRLRESTTVTITTPPSSSASSSSFSSSSSSSPSFLSPSSSSSSSSSVEGAEVVPSSGLGREEGKQPEGRQTGGIVGTEVAEGSAAAGGGGGGAVVSRELEKEGDFARGSAAERVQRLVADRLNHIITTAQSDAQALAATEGNDDAAGATVEGCHLLTGPDVKSIFEQEDVNDYDLGQMAKSAVGQPGQGQGLDNKQQQQGTHKGLVISLLELLWPGFLDEEDDFEGEDEEGEDEIIAIRQDFLIL